jgi:hypothetical protein
VVLDKAIVNKEIPNSNEMNQINFAIFRNWKYSHTHVLLGFI